MSVRGTADGCHLTWRRLFSSPEARAVSVPPVCACLPKTDGIPRLLTAKAGKRRTGSLGRPARWHFWPISRIPRQWNLRSRKGRHGSARSMPWSAMQASPNRSCSRISPTRTGCACWMSISWVRCARFAPCCLKCCTTTREASLRCRPCGESAARPARAIIPRARLRSSA